jgi:hypothetical protein
MQEILAHLESQRDIRQTPRSSLPAPKYIGGALAWTPHLLTRVAKRFESSNVLSLQICADVS